MISKKIDYFLTVAETLNFTQAAAIHNVSQTAISQYIAGLEERLEVRLFDRTRHSVALTEAGRYYYEKVKTMLAEYEETTAMLKTIAAQYHGYVKVGIGVYEYCSTEGLFSDFLSQHPEIKVDIMQYTYSELSEKLRTGELDLIIGVEFCESDFSKKEIQIMPLFESANYLAVHKDIASKYQKNDVNSILSGECLITNCEDYGPSSLLMLHNLLNDEVGFIPSRIEQTNSVNAQLMMVRAKHGVAIVPDFVIESQNSDLVSLPMPSGKMIRYQLMRLSGNKNPAADLLFNFARS